MMDSLAFIITILPRLLEGLLTTLYLGSLSFLIGLALAVFVTPLRSFTKGVIPLVVRGYVEVFRGTPLLVQIFIIYFGLPSLGMKFDPLTAGILALGLNSAAYQAEILRSSIKSIPESQFLSAESLGMSSPQIYRYVVLPQALRVAIPALVNEFVTIIKESSLVSVIGVVELTRKGEYIVAFSFRALETYLAVALVYFIVCTAFSQILRLIEKRTKIPGFEAGMK